MNDLQKELQELKEKVAKLELRIVDKPVKWQPEGGKYLIMSNGEVVEASQTSINDTMAKLFGTRRQTEKQAERASIEMRRFNRLLALRDELCEDEVVNWSSNDSKFHIHFHTTEKVWFVGLAFQCQFIMPYFTSQEAAQKACDMLNSGEVVL